MPLMLSVGRREGQLRPLHKWALACPDYNTMADIIDQAVFSKSTVRLMLHDGGTQVLDPAEWDFLLLLHEEI